MIELAVGVVGAGMHVHMLALDGQGGRWHLLRRRSKGRT